MSYRVGTIHYNLPQTEGTDKRDWSDTNQAFADLDAAVYEAGSDAGLALSAAQTAQTSADGAVADASSAVTTANAASASASSASELATLARTEAQSAVTTAGQANTTAQAAQTTASNADTVALAAQTNIGTMANLQTTDKSSLVAAINEVLSQIGGGGMPTFDFANPLHTFSGTNLSYTAVDDCYVVGTLTSPAGTNNTVSLSVNTAIIFQANGTGNYNTQEITKIPVPILHVKAGDVVAVSSECASLHVYAAE